MGLKLLAALLAWFLASETRLQAYLDPGSGSMLLQLLFGGVAGAAVLIRLAWRRLRNRFQSARTRTNHHDG